MADYGRWLKVSFRKENGNGNDEFIALGATSGEPKGKSPEPSRALSAVRPPTTALGSLSSGALSSERVNGSYVQPSPMARRNY